VNIRHILKVLYLQGLQKSFGRNSTICVSKNEAVCCEVRTHFGSFRLSSFIKKSSGRIFPIDASKNEVVCRGVQTDFKSSLPASFTEKVVGAIRQFVRPKMKLFAVKFRRISEVNRLQGLQKNFWTNFHDLCVQNEALCCEVQTHFASFPLARFIKKL